MLTKINNSFWITLTHLTQSKYYQSINDPLCFLYIGLLKPQTTQAWVRNIPMSISNGNVLYT